MATLDELVEQGHLRRQGITNLGRNEFEERKFYVTPDFRKWLYGPVMTEVAFYPTNTAPRRQAADLLKSFIIGRPFLGSRMFKRMSPRSDDIYELRSADLRFFGWFPQKDHFVAVKGDFFANLKTDTSLYELHRIDCLKFRAAIDLDEPKYAPGAGEYDVVSC